MEFLLTKNGLFNKTTETVQHRVFIPDIMPSAVLPTHAHAASGRAFLFRDLHAIAIQVFVQRIWSHREFVAVSLWLRSYEAGGALPGAMTFTSPYNGFGVTFSVLLDHLVDWDHFKNTEPVIPRIDDEHFAHAVGAVLTDDVQNLRFEEPGEVETATDIVLDATDLLMTEFHDGFDVTLDDLIGDDESLVLEELDWNTMDEI